MTKEPRKACRTRRKVMMRTIIARRARLRAGSSRDGGRTQDWPTRPVTMVVPFAAGGAVDTGGRIMAPHLPKSSANR